MPFSVRYDPESDCVFASIEGEIDLQTAKEFGEAVVEQTAAHNCRRLLNDLRKAKVKLSTLEIYDLPALIEKVGLDRRCKRALVVSRDFEDYIFFRNVSSHSGHIVEIFGDSDKFSIFRTPDRAKKWLGLQPETLDSQ
jgi:hypothetical protein